MADYFFDTSALVKRHVTEAGSAWVNRIVRAKTDHTLYIARITAVEVTSAITRRQHNGDLSPTQAGAILGHFRRYLTQRYRVVELSPALFIQAAAAARKHRLRARRRATGGRAGSPDASASCGPGAGYSCFVGSRTEPGGSG